MMKKKGGGGGAGMSGTNYGNVPSPVKSSAETKSLEEEIQRLQIQIQQRDNEIGILLNHLNKK